MTVDTKLHYDQEYVSQFSKSLNEPNWLTELRVKALEQVESLPLPKADKTNINNWNFTDFKHGQNGNPIQSLNELPKEVQSLISSEENKNLIIQHNSTFAYATVTDNLKAQGVIFTDIHTAAKEHTELLQKYYMTDAVKVDEHKLTALHTALMNGGVFIYVPKNVEVSEPLQAIYWQDEHSLALFNHVIVVAEDNSSVTYVENYLSFNEGAAVANIVSEVIAGTNAKVTYGAVDHLSKNTTTYINRRGIADRDARIEWALGQMNDGDTVSNNHTFLMGDGSYADTKSVVVGKGEQKQNFTTNITHYGKASEGYILQHGVMKEAASAIFNGIGKIEHGASKSNAEQESRVLMLSEKARGDANPILLIEEDDVTAGHAASVGRVNPTDLYYLMSRGISKTEAERLVIHGFLAPVVKELAIESVQKQLVEVIERKVR